MMGVTLSLGGLVVAAASSQLGLSSGSATLGASLRQSGSETQISMVYAAAQPSVTCTAYRGFQEGTTLVLALYDYGSAGFTPVGFVVNSTDYAGAYGPLAPGSMGQYSLALSSCAHSSGLSVLAYDALGDEVQLET